MFLHIGGDTVIAISSIIAVFDMDATTVSKDTREFLRVAEEEGFVEAVNEELPKSFIITEQDKKSRIYLSPISSVTLKKREGYVRSICNLWPEKKENNINEKIKEKRKNIKNI